MITNNVILTIFLIYITGYIFCYYFMLAFRYFECTKEEKYLIYDKEERLERFNLSFFWFFFVPFVIIFIILEYYSSSDFSQKLINLKEKILNSQSKWF